MTSRSATERRLATELFRFLLVGGVGFVVDAGVLMFLIRLGQVSRIGARIPSFLIAVTVTWWLHRTFTFKGKGRAAPSLSEWGHFVLANALGNAFKLGVYWALIGLLGWEPLPALGVASIAAAAVNYGMSARWVFR